MTKEQKERLEYLSIQPVLTDLEIYEYAKLDQLETAEFKTHSHYESSNEEYFECENEYINGTWCI